MKGSISKYSVSGSSRPKWRFRLRLGIDANGRELREGRGGFSKESEARAAMQTRIAELKAGRGSSAPTPVTLGDWLQHWLSTYAPEKCTPKTLERYMQLASYVPADLSMAPLSELRHAHIEASMRALLRAPAKRRAHLSAKTVRHVAGVLNVALNKAFRLDMIQVNPMQRVELPAVERSQVRSLTKSEVQALRVACRGDWTFGLVELLLSTGARRGEALALTWSCIDFPTRMVTISKSVEQTAKGLRIKSTKTEKPRSCALPQAAITALLFLREQQTENKRLCGAAYEDHDLVFCQPDGRFMDPALVSQTIVRRMRKAGIQDASMHVLRHTHASTLLSNGLPLPAVAARLGHSDQTTTLRIYSHALQDDDRRAADLWDTITDSVQ